MVPDSQVMLLQTWEVGGTSNRAPTQELVGTVWFAAFTHTTSLVRTPPPQVTLQAL